MYQGGWTQKLVNAVQSEGGKLTMADMQNYQPIWTDPAHTRHGDIDAYESNVPNTGIFIDGVSIPDSAVFQQTFMDYFGNCLLILFT